MESGSSQTQLTTDEISAVVGVGHKLPTLAGGLPHLSGDPPPGDRHPALFYVGSLRSGESRRTQASALRTVAALFGRSLEAMPWQALTAVHLYALRSVLTDRYSPATANRYLGTAREVVRWAGRLGFLTAAEVETAVDVPGVEGSRLPAGRALTLAEVRQLLDTARADQWRRRGARDAAVVGLLWGGGLRRVEVARLDLARYQSGAVKVLGKGNKERSVPLPEGARRALAAWLELRGEEPGPLLYSVSPWGARLRPDAVGCALVQLARRAGVAGVSTHDGRRTVITALFDAGANPGAIQDLVGHANPAQTAKYRRDREAAKARAVELLTVPYV